MYVHNKNQLIMPDEETVLTITENPYLQYFIGLHEFQETPPFHSSSMTHFRKRFDADFINEINERIVQKQRNDEKDSKDDDSNGGSFTSTPSDKCNLKNDATQNQGKLLLDATCAPSDITYPTDVGLLNNAREKLESMIDTLHAPFVGKQQKPRTYRKKARNQYLALSKQRKPGAKKIRKAIKQQLSYVRRNLKHITELVSDVGLQALSNKQYHALLVIQELYRQQMIMFKEKSSSIQDRIVSISQPHVRPIVRGKKIAHVEFGANLSVSVVDGYAFLDVLSWDPYHEGKQLRESVEKYKNRYGYYPETVIADAIYRTRENRSYCKERGIRLSGSNLERPPKNKQANVTQRRIEKQDASAKNAIEGKFGEGKRGYGLALFQHAFGKRAKRLFLSVSF